MCLKRMTTIKIGLSVLYVETLLALALSLSNSPALHAVHRGLRMIGIPVGQIATVTEGASQWKTHPAPDGFVISRTPGI